MSALPILDRHEMLRAATEKLATRGTVDTDLIQTMALLVIAHALDDIAFEINVARNVLEQKL